MDKKELIEYCESLKGNLNKFINGIDVNKIIAKIEQLDEPQKVQVPQFVADWIEEGKKHCKDVFDLFDFDFTNEEVGNWFVQEKPFDLVARAWLDGYTVEKEKRYIVKMKGMSEENTFLTFRFGHTWILSNFEECEEFRLYHTRKELEEAGFGEVFNSPLFEVEEV